MREQCLQLVKTRLSEAGRHTMDDAGDGASSRITFACQLDNQVLHFLGNFFIWATHHCFVHLLPCDRVQPVAILRIRNVERVRSNTRHPCNTPVTRTQAHQALLRYSAANHTPNSLSSRRSPSARRCMSAIFCIVREIGVRGSRNELGQILWRRKVIWCSVGFIFPLSFLVVTFAQGKGVVLRSLILVVNFATHWCTKSQSKFSA
mmetsp:Transcript_12504/g.22718  ORF Transcript_12504/g.22718 Transcript_12504/m.22718 type:complete len:205 (-) Transcript_12504:283-897(-)